MAIDCRRLKGRHRHHQVEFEDAARLRGDRDRMVIAEHLGDHHRQRFDDHGVHLARHDGTARLHFRQ